MNNIKAFFLLAGLTLLLLALGDILAAHLGIFLGAFLAILMILNGCLYSDRALLRIYRAKKLSEKDHPELHAAVKTMASKANLPVPQVHRVESDMSTAFVVGRKVSGMHLVVTSGLLNLLNQNELTAVVAYQMGHICHSDVFLGSVLASISNGIVGITDKGVWMDLLGLNDHPHASLNRYAIAVFGPIAGLLVRTTVSPEREFEADRFAAVHCGHPEWLIAALEKIEATREKAIFNTVETHPGTAHLFVVNPLRDKKLAKWFATHPSTDARIARLKLPHQAELSATSS